MTRFPDQMANGASNACMTKNEAKSPAATAPMATASENAKGCVLTRVMSPCNPSPRISSAD
jgi:hypothetical protein